MSKRRLSAAARERVEMYDTRERRWADRVTAASTALLRDEQRAVAEWCDGR
ncbi:MAG: hypothetical protein H6875_10625 [Hyphomicrobiaceae bacterium]|nr:hypothetical protein [Hyphomicrobiaceae bacterium]